MTDINFVQLRFAARECEFQQSGEMSVYRMLVALNEMERWAKEGVIISPLHIAVLGRTVEPNANPTGFRSVPVIVRGTLIPVMNFNRQLLMLLDAKDTLVPLEFYTEFERIHPFVDGNGRVGAILYNWLLGTLDRPTLPPDVFGGHDDHAA